MPHFLLKTTGALVAASALFAAGGCARETAPEPETAPKPAETPAPTPQDPPMTVTVVIETSMGTMQAELYQDKAPITVANFLAYADAGFYDGTIFHRVIPNFMIQGGGFTPDMDQKPTRAQIKNEAANGLKNARGTLAMARTPVVDSATCQFFINHKDNAFLDYQAPTQQGFGYCVFGKLTEGLDVLDKIAAVQTGRHPTGHGDVPREPVTILSVKRAAK